MKCKKILTQRIEDNVLPMGYNQDLMVIRVFIRMQYTNHPQDHEDKYPYNTKQECYHIFFAPVVRKKINKQEHVG